MKILIVDDELLERKAMKKFIGDNFENMKVVGEAENGRKAIELAKEKQPNIIFMDIKMPGVNGLEAIEQIHHQQPAIKFILVSAYDTFDYAKQAMQFGIKDYILKPGKKEEIVKALFRLQKEIVEEEKLEEEKRQSQQLLEERLIRRLMKQPFQQELLALQNQLFPMMKCGYFLGIGGAKPLDLKIIQESFTHHLGHDFILYEAADIVVALVIVNDVETKANQLLFARKLSLALNQEVFIGIGQIEESLDKFPLSYGQAYAAYYQLAAEGKSRTGFLQENAQHPREEIIEQIAQAVEQGNYEIASEKFGKSEAVLEVIDKERLYIIIQNVFSKRNISTIDRSIASLQSSDDWNSYLRICCQKMNEYCYSKQSMSRARAYIEAYFAEGITLEDVASVVNLSPNYFSNVFKEEFGETFIEFLTKTRMEKAKLLIEKNTYSLKEICFKVGYKDPNYFSRVFKKHFHISPRHFQGSIFEK